MNDSDVGEEVRKLRADIRRRLFRTVRAFLMPFPGNKVFKGQLHDGNLEGQYNKKLFKLTRELKFISQPILMGFGRV